jgi:phosphate transport system substrate-binding protein
MQNCGAIYPPATGFQGAVAGANWQNLRTTNSPAVPGDHGATYRCNPDKPAEGAAALKFFDWAYKNGDKTADDLDYVPMPAVVKSQIEKAWGQIQDASGKPIAYK